jgi:hypothetical protein
MISDLFVGPAESGSGTNIYTYGQGKLWVEVFVTDDGQYYAEVTDIHTDKKRVTTVFSTNAEIISIITQHCNDEYYNNY